MYTNTYFIADNDGNIYAHDIKDYNTADAILANIIDNYKERGEDVPEGLEVLRDEEGE